jgi:callose synthase
MLILWFSPNDQVLLCTTADLMKGYKAAESGEGSKSERSLWAQCQAVADMKFSYVVSCQQYGNQKRSSDIRAKDILNLMIKYVF